ncbi:MAG: terminase [Muribaculaceae bacterium]|nr:terminase [Muribaculaceae bacterium]
MTVEEILSENRRRLEERLLPAAVERLPGMAEHRARCRADFRYWAATCCHIKRKGGGEDILFRLNRPQLKLVAALESMRAMGRPIRLILLKARQWGGSTCAQLYMAWLQLMHLEGLNSLIIAHQHAATAEIRDMFVRMIESYPEDMLESVQEDRPQRSGKRRAKSSPRRTEGAGPGTIRIPSMNFKVKVGSAERPDSCRGGDYSLVHCSEVALWKKTRLKTPEDMFRAACSGVLLQPLTMILLESTANGTGNFFHTEYESAKRGESQFTPLFVAWYEIEQYSLPFEEGKATEFAEMLLAGKENTQPTGDRSQPGAYLWWLWNKGATLEAIHWYVNERRKYSDHAQMASEYPSDDIEAFVHSGARVFDRYKVEAFRGGCTAVSVRGEIEGKEISGPGSLSGLEFREDSQGALKIWKKPDEEGRYSDRYLTVVDIGGRSFSSDWSVIVVFDRLGMLEDGRPEVVAQWRGHADFDILAWNAARIASYYCNSLLVIESNTLETHDRERSVEGDQSGYILYQLRQAYTNLYARKRSPEEIRDGAPLKYGFHTNVATKPLIISNLVRVVRDGLYIEREPECLDEFLTYEQRPDGSYGAISGKHDDLLMTRAIGLHVCFNEMPLPACEAGMSDFYSRQRRHVSSAAYF